MRRRLLAFIAGAVLLPAVAAGSAAADDPLVQGAGQSALARPGHPMLPGVVEQQGIEQARWGVRRASCSTAFATPV